MTGTLFLRLPREVVDMIFEYLSAHHIAYSFFDLTDRFSSAVHSFLGQHLNLTRIDDPAVFQYCLSDLLPVIGCDLRSLSIGQPYQLLTYLQAVALSCPELENLEIVCCSNGEDIRQYAQLCLHRQLKSFSFKFKGSIVGEQIADRLLEKFGDAGVKLSSSLTLHLSSMQDLVLLKRLCQSDYLHDGSYMFECLVNGKWLTDTDEDLCISSKSFAEESLFAVQQIDPYQCSREYQFVHVQSQRRLSVSIPCPAEERWISSSILSVQRRDSSQNCSTFTFERIDQDDDELFYIRPCYSRAKRLQASGKRVIISISPNETTLEHRFRLHRIS